ncbi:MAG: hypothetical protein ACPHK2_03940, partial [Candidatus Poseidoniaceae archaeon]
PQGYYFLSQRHPPMLELVFEILILKDLSYALNQKIYLEFPLILEPLIDRWSIFHHHHEILAA